MDCRIATWKRCSPNAVSRWIRHGLPVGAAIYSAAGRRGAALSTCLRGSVVRGPDLCQSGWTLGLSVADDRPVRPGHRRAGVRKAGAGGHPPVLHPRLGVAARTRVRSLPTGQPPTRECSTSCCPPRAISSSSTPTTASNPIMDETDARPHTTPSSTRDQHRARIRPEPAPRPLRTRRGNPPKALTLSGLQRVHSRHLSTTPTNQQRARRARAAGVDRMVRVSEEVWIYDLPDDAFSQRIADRPEVDVD
jgi:hypothetical protein